MRVSLLLSLLLVTHVQATPVPLIDMMDKMEAAARSHEYAIIYIKEPISDTCSVLTLVAAETGDETDVTHCVDGIEELTE